MAHAEANAASITLADGKDILIAIHLGSKARATNRGPVPRWGAMWLQEQWRGGRKVHEMGTSIYPMI